MCKLKALLLVVVILAFTAKGYAYNVLEYSPGFEEGLYGWNVTGFQRIQSFVDNGGVEHLPSENEWMMGVSDELGTLTTYFMFSDPLTSISFDLNLVDPSFGDNDLDAFGLAYSFYYGGSIMATGIMHHNLTDSNTWGTVTYDFPEWTYRPENNINNRLIPDRVHTFRITVEPNSSIILFSEEPSATGVGAGTALIDNIRLNAVVPIPSGIWLLGSGLIGLVGFRRKVKNV